MAAGEQISECATVGCQCAGEPIEIGMSHNIDQHMLIRAVRQVPLLSSREISDSQ